MNFVKNAFMSVLRRVYQEVIVEKYKEVAFWVLSSFLVSFALARTVVRLFPNTFLVINSSHIHHFAYGFILLAIAGYVSLIKPGRAPVWLACLYGAGLGLAVDESGMWLHLTNLYYNDTSEDIIVFIIAVLVNIVYFGEFWVRLLTALRNLVRFRHGRS